MTMITGWGTNTHFREVHYFDDTGMPLCRISTRRRSKATLPFPRWNPENPSTCPICRRMLALKQEEKEGATPAPCTGSSSP